MEQFDFFSNTEPAIQDEGGKLVFRSNVSPTAEVNQFLTGLSLTCLNVEFIAMNLGEIDFENFGWKIRHLTITNCLVPNEEALKNMFVNTQNIICLKFYRLDETGYLAKILTNVLEAFAREETFCNDNLESICADMTAISPDVHIKIFPSLKTFTWDPSIPFTGHFNSQLQNRVEEIYKFFVDLDVIRQTPLDIASAPNLKTLIGELKFTPFTNEYRVRDIYLKLFSAFSNLEKLKLKVTFYTYSKDEQELTKCAAKMLLFTVIHTCGKLRSLHLNMVEWCTIQRTYRSVPVIYLDRMESRELCEVMHRLESFTVKDIDCDRNSFKNQLSRMNGVPKLKFLQMDGFPYARGTDTDLRRMVIDFYPTIEYLIILVDLRIALWKCQSMIHDLQRILDSVKSLRTLRIYFHSYTGSILNVGRVRGLALNHENLEHFQLKFSGLNEYALFDATYSNKFSFPNLSTFHINYSQSYCSNLSSDAIIEVFEKIKFQLFKMIKTMPEGLTNIKLPSGRFFLMHIADVLKICESKPNLRQLEWTSLDDFTSPILKHIFVVLCPKLSRAIVHTYREPTDSAKCRTVQYFYSRRQKALFESELKKINGVYRPSTFRLI